MTGKGCIVINTNNRQQFFEHASLAAATAEAERLAVSNSRDSFVVYVPMSISKAKLVETTPVYQGDLRKVHKEVDVAFLVKEEVPF